MDQLHAFALSWMLTMRDEAAVVHLNQPGMELLLLMLEQAHELSLFVACNRPQLPAGQLPAPAGLAKDRYILKRARIPPTRGAAKFWKMAPPPPIVVRLRTALFSRF